jgi:hypothetical protein
MPVYPGASVQQERDHHRRVIRRPATTIAAVVGAERAQVQLLDRAQDAPHEVILRDPIQQRRRHQELLVAAAGNEVPRHPGIQLIAPDGTLFPTATPRSSSAASVVRLFGALLQPLQANRRRRWRRLPRPAERSIPARSLVTGHDPREVEGPRGPSRSDDGHRTDNLPLRPSLSSGHSPERLKVIDCFLAGA